MLETVEGEVSLLEVLEALKVLEVLYATPYAGGCGVFSFLSDWNFIRSKPNGQTRKPRS